MKKINFIFFVILSSFIFSDSLLNYNIIYHKELEKLSKTIKKQEKDLKQQENYWPKSPQLEWHVLFSSFYEENRKGRDNTKENAKYRSKVEGYYDINGNNSINNYSKIVHNNIILLNETGKISSLSEKFYTTSSIVNAGLIKTNGISALDGIQILIKPDMNTLTISNTINFDFTLSGISMIVSYDTNSKPIIILPNFADGTIADVYKLEGLIKASSGQYSFISSSLLWEANPVPTTTGADVYMSRKPFTSFTEGLWFEDFGKTLENNFIGSSGEKMKLYNKINYITNEITFRHIMESMAGNIYSNINQREEDIARTFSNALYILENSSNNTRENVKINVISGKGKNKEKTDGVIGYSSETVGILALRESEKNHKHTFAYSLGYLHTGFEFNDNNDSEEYVNTIQLGLHSKYKTNDWTIKNNILGRVSIHNINRNIDWFYPLERSEMTGNFETYSISTDNILGRVFPLGKKINITPYGALGLMYITRPNFEESGLEKLEIKGNDAWSIKPRVGVELETSLNIGKSAWELKALLDIDYEYELADLNVREKAKLVVIESNYHNLSKPEDEKGTLRTKTSVGIENKNKYGFFLTGEYEVRDRGKNDYRAGINLKAVF